MDITTVTQYQPDLLLPSVLLVVLVFGCVFVTTTICANVSDRHGWPLTVAVGAGMVIPAIIVLVVWGFPTYNSAQKIIYSTSAQAEEYKDQKWVSVPGSLDKEILRVTSGNEIYQGGAVHPTDDEYVQESELAEDVMYVKLKVSIDGKMHKYRLYHVGDPTHQGRDFKLFEGWGDE